MFQPARWGRFCIIKNFPGARDRFPGTLSFGDWASSPGRVVSRGGCGWTNRPFPPQRGGGFWTDLAITGPPFPVFEAVYNARGRSHRSDGAEQTTGPTPAPRCFSSPSGQKTDNPFPPSASAVALAPPNLAHLRTRMLLSSSASTRRRPSL
ncbi:hypothetical protein [Macropodid alphaherpesvirus 1]|uniref:Uncharacterized protein n=1 Tax=Macropodid alphaherpesvirus 1 TaxID=137443 RepID=A0A0Y0A6I5_9ALPH|nr:hypothetical protein [Macropodid alphaherpesvirus 1]YP_009227231.1 hypothetical protein [Macropodid alphaherpesvirus 1]AMB17058.1 hypothetical protein [Macropodid alphaherpesvirus 1]AMB17059.1 hypothetical protein [Macropodid alphaherpesvirus 1]